MKFQIGKTIRFSEEVVLIVDDVSVTIPKGTDGVIKSLTTKGVTVNIGRGILVYAPRNVWSIRCKRPPCPWCGCTDVDVEYVEHDYTWRSLCTNCGAHGPHGSDTRQGAIENWDSRKCGKE